MGAYFAWLAVARVRGAVGVGNGWGFCCSRTRWAASSTCRFACRTSRGTSSKGGRRTGSGWRCSSLGRWTSTARGGMDWFHGGLQFQTEHHLVPRMPRHKLRRFREETLRPWLKAHGLTMDDSRRSGRRTERCGARSRNVRESGEALAGVRARGQPGGVNDGRDRRRSMINWLILFCYAVHVHLLIRGS